MAKHLDVLADLLREHASVVEQGRLEGALGCVQYGFIGLGEEDRDFIGKGLQVSRRSVLHARKAQLERLRDKVQAVDQTANALRPLEDELQSNFPSADV